MLREDGKTQVRLQKTRAKGEAEGIVKTLSNWATQKLHQWAFVHLIEKGMADLVGESIILRYPDRFDSEVLEAAKKRLALAGLSH